MGYIIEITEDKLSDLAEHVGKMLKHGGKAMECIEELHERRGFSERWDEKRHMEEEERRHMDGGYGRRFDDGYGDRRRGRYY